MSVGHLPFLLAARGYLHDALLARSPLSDLPSGLCAQCFPHLAAGGGSEGFWMNNVPAVSILLTALIRVAGHVRHPHAGVRVLYSIGQIGAFMRASPRRQPRVKGPAGRIRNASSADSAPNTWYPIWVSMVRVRFRTCGHPLPGGWSPWLAVAASAPGRTADSSSAVAAGR